jgi:hypothetical protein
MRKGTLIDIVRVYRAEQPMGALDDISASAKQQEGTSSIGALGLPLV